MASHNRETIEEIAEKEERERNRQQFISHNKGEFRRYLEKGNFSNVSDDLRREYQSYRGKLLRMKGDYKRERYVLDVLSNLSKENSNKNGKRKEAEEYLNEAGQLLRDNKIYRKSREFLDLAKRMGFQTREGGREGTKILSPDGNMVIETVPDDHGMDIKTGVSKRMMRNYARGESNFRKQDVENSQENRKKKSS